MRISIAMSYYNRKQQLINSLNTIKLSKLINDVEVIIVDDCSNEEHKLDDILPAYPFVKLITLKSEDRWYTNPCVPFNKAIKECKGDIILLQNPECLHMGDILSDINKNINNRNYLVYGTYSINKIMSNALNKLEYNNNVFNKINKIISPINNVGYIGEGTTCWYNHSIYRPVGYHFMSAMLKENMNKLNGFDERFSNGIGFDDDEFLFRIKLLGLDIEIKDKPFAIHQWHYSENNFFAKEKNISEALRKNQSLFQNITKLKKEYYAPNK